MNQLCPLCDRAATYRLVQHEPGGKLFTCPSCTEFFIDEHSEAHLAGLATGFREPHRKDLQRRAKACGPAGLFVMRAPREDEVHGSGHGIAREEMIAGCFSR